VDAKFLSAASRGHPLSFSGRSSGLAFIGRDWSWIGIALFGAITGAVAGSCIALPTSHVLFGPRIVQRTVDGPPHA